MDFGGIIREAWTMTWRYRFLWILGLLAGTGLSLPSGPGGNGAQWRADRSDLNRMPAEVAQFAAGAEAWAAANAGLLIGLAIVGVLMALALVVLSLIAQGAITRAGTEIDEGQAVTLGSAWREGLHLFWRYLGLWLLAAAAAMLVAAIIGAVVALAFGIGALTGSVAAGATIPIVAYVAVIAAFDWFVLAHTASIRAPRWAIGLAATLFALPLFTILILVGIAVATTFTFAARSIAVEDVGPWQALARAWRLVSGHAADSALVWLVNLALGIAAGIVGMVLAFAAAVVLGGIGALLWATLGFGAVLAGYTALGGLVFLVAGAVVLGIVGTFLWNYWTVAYLRLTGRESHFASA